MRTKTLAITLLAVSLLAGACGRSSGDGGSGGSNGIDHPTGADQLVLRMQVGGGFVAQEYSLRALPGFSLYGDGRLIVQGPVIEIYPGPALPNIQVSRLTEEAVQTLLTAAREAGLLGEDASYDYPCVADVPTTTFTVVAESRIHTVSAYALGFDAGMTGSACEGVDVEARAKLLDFSAKLGDLRSWLPEGSIGPEQEYSPTEMRVYVRPYQPDPTLGQTAVAWPLDGSLASFGEQDPNLADTRCGVVAGEDLTKVLSEARSANELTPWTSEGKDHALLFRPLLPDEHTC